MRVKIEGVPPYDGEYEFKSGKNLTNRDHHDIKRITGHMPLEYEEAADRGDLDFLVAFAVIALRKSGRFAKIDEDLIWDSEAGKITLISSSEEEDEAGPPLNAPETLTSPSGAPSRLDGVHHPGVNLAPTGTESSDS